MKPICYCNGGDEQVVHVDNRCPKCGRFLPLTVCRIMLSNSGQTIHSADGECPRCGAVKLTAEWCL